MTLSETLEPVRPLNRALATPPSSAASREPMENMARGGSTSVAAVAVRVSRRLSLPRIQRPKNRGAWRDRVTRAALGFSAAETNRASGVSAGSAT